MNYFAYGHSAALYKHKMLGRLGTVKIQVNAALRFETNRQTEMMMV
jgi:hypothetical protein